MRKSLMMIPVLMSAVLLLPACGGGSGSPTPAAPTPAVDLTGTWDESTGGSLTWRLTQTGERVTGSSQFSEDTGPFGAVSGQGAISGTVANGVFTFTDTYSTLTRPNCSLVASGHLTITGGVMSGAFGDVDSCNGVVIANRQGTIRMRRR